MCAGGSNLRPEPLDGVGRVRVRRLVEGELEAEVVEQVAGDVGGFASRAADPQRFAEDAPVLLDQLVGDPGYLRARGRRRPAVRLGLDDLVAAVDRVEGVVLLRDHAGEGTVVPA